MTDTKGDGKTATKYQIAQTISLRAASSTISETVPTKVVPATDSGKPISMRVVPRPPKQTGGDARTD